MGSGRTNPLTLPKNRYKNKHNLALGDQFWYQNPPFKEITIKWLEQKGIIFQDTSGTPQLNMHRSLAGGRASVGKVQESEGHVSRGRRFNGVNNSSIP